MRQAATQTKKWLTIGTALLAAAVGSLEAVAQDRLTRLQQGISGVQRELVTARNDIQSFQFPDDRGIYLRPAVMERIVAMRNRVREVVRSLELEALEVYTEQYFDESIEMLESVEDLVCADCVTKFSADRAYAHIAEGNGTVLALRDVESDLMTWSNEGETRVRLYVSGGHDYLYESYTDGDLRSVYVGLYDAVASKDGFSDAEFKLDLVRNGGDTIRCTMRSGASVCRHE